MGLKCQPIYKYGLRGSHDPAHIWALNLSPFTHGKSTPRSLNLSSNYKIVIQPQNPIYDIPHLTKPFTLRPSVVLTPVLSDVVAISDPRGPHMSGCHFITSFISLPLPSSSFSQCSHWTSGRAADGWGGGRRAKEVRRRVDGGNAAVHILVVTAMVAFFASFR